MCSDSPLWAAGYLCNTCTCAWFCHLLLPFSPYFSLYDIFFSFFSHLLSHSCSPLISPLLYLSLSVLCLPPLSSSFPSLCVGVSSSSDVQKGDVILVHRMSVGDGWWEGELDGFRGLFPCSYVKLVSNWIAIQNYNTYNIIALCCIGWPYSISVRSLHALTLCIMKQSGRTIKYDLVKHSIRIFSSKEKNWLNKVVGYYTRSGW